MIPPVFRISVIAVYLGLALFGVMYNKLVENGERQNWIAGHMSFAVVIGDAVTVAAVVLAFWSYYLPGWAWGVLVTGALACSGSPMIIGSRVRHARELVLQAKIRKGHRGLRWPNDMSALRNEAADEALAGLRALASLEGLPDAATSKAMRARAALMKVAALLSQAGAPVDLTGV